MNNIINGTNMEFIKSLLEANSQAQLIQNMKLAKSIIKKYENDSSSYRDFLVRIIGYTNGLARPTEKDDAIDIIPALEELAKRGLVVKNKNGTYKRTEALSKLMAVETKSAEQRALSGDLSKRGRLGLTQTSNMAHLAGDDDIADKINRAPRNYKKGGLYSGTTKELVQAHTQSDDEWKSLPEEIKETVGRLQTLENPLASIKILQDLVRLKKLKKGYVPFVNYVMDTYKDESYLDALYDLDTIGTLSVKTGTLNMQSIERIKQALDFFKENGDQSISPMMRVAAFLPRFAKSATSVSARQHRAINNMLSNPKFKKVFDIINTRLTDSILSDILSADERDLRQNKPTAYYVRFLADNLNATTVEELKSAIEKKRTLYQNFKSDENKAAKDQGRFDRFKRDF